MAKLTEQQIFDLFIYMNNQARFRWSTFREGWVRFRGDSVEPEEVIKPEINGLHVFRKLSPGFLALVRILSSLAEAQEYMSNKYYIPKIKELRADITQKVAYRLELLTEDGETVDCMIIYAVNDADAEDIAIDNVFDEVAYYELTPASKEDLEKYRVGTFVVAAALEYFPPDSTHHHTKELEQ